MKSGHALKVMMLCEHENIVQHTLSIYMDLSHNLNIYTLYNSYIIKLYILLLSHMSIRKNIRNIPI